MGSQPWPLLLLAAPCLGLLLLESLTLRGLPGKRFEYFGVVLSSMMFMVFLSAVFYRGEGGWFLEWGLPRLFCGTTFWFCDSAAPLVRILSPGLRCGRVFFLALHGLAPFAPG